MKNKLKLFLIITALLASCPAAFAENGDIYFTDDAAEEVIDDIAFNDADEILEADILMLEEDAQLNGEAVPWDGITVAEPSIGEDGAYEISNGAQLAWIAEQVNSQRDRLGKYSGMNGMTIRLTEDIDLNGQPWTPIGYGYDRPFAGDFDGDGHTVKELDFNAADFTNCGLFGCVLGSVHDVNVETTGAGIITSRHVTPSNGDPTKYGIGIVAGSVDERLWDYDNRTHSGSIERCTAYGSLSVSNAHGESIYIGGIAGVNSGGSLADNTNNAAISSESSAKHKAERAFVGGITGCNYGEIYNTEDFSPASAAGSVSVISANPSVGAVAGGNAGHIHDIAYTGSGLSVGKYASAYDENVNIGGIVGLNSGKLERCSFDLELKPEIKTLAVDSVLNIGGIAGSVTGLLSKGGIIDECTASGNLAAEADAFINIGLILGTASDETALLTDCVTDNGSVAVKNALKDLHIGAIAGEASCVIDGCAVTSSAVTADGSAPVSAGGIVGISYNTVTDCEVSADVTASCTSDDYAAYTGGIAGSAYGNITRAYYTNGTVLCDASLAYAGGIAGYTNIDSSSVLSDDAEKLTVSKCRFGENALIKASLLSGGIIGAAGNTIIASADSAGTISVLHDGDPAVSGGIAGAIQQNSEIENCIVTANLGTSASAGVAFKADDTGIGLSSLYLAPTFVGVTEKNAVTEHFDNVTATGIYLNKDIAETDLTQDGVTTVSNEEAAVRSTFKDSFDFSNTWNMGKISPVLQFTAYSNAVSRMTAASEMKLDFHVTLENPQIGQCVYVALYNESGRFCGVTSAKCSDSDICGSHTKAEFALSYWYSYWYNPKNFDENGNLKPDDELIPSDDVPKTAKAFTWDEKTGLKNLSSVYVDSLDIKFE